MSRSKTSKAWLKEHFDDRWVQASRTRGYRSRSSFKLLEIQEKDRIVEPGMNIVDLGAAPGGWSQAVVELLGGKGRVIASDILDMEPIEGVEFIPGDFTEDSVYEAILRRLDNKEADLVISDMAPNMSGMKAIDQPRAMLLAELAHDLARSVLKRNGSLLVKVFQGEGLQAFQQALKQDFDVVRTRKPSASRARSSENYLLARGFRP